MENIFMISQSFKFNVQIVKDKGFPILAPLVLTYLQYQGYIKLAKSKSKSIKDFNKYSILLAYIDLEKQEKMFEKGLYCYSLTAEETVSLNSGFQTHAIVVTMPETDPLYTTIHQAACQIRETIDFEEQENICTFFNFYQYIREQNINDSEIKECAQIIFDLYSDSYEYSSDYAGLNKKEYSEITKLMLHLLAVKNGCIVHPWAGPANIISQLNPNIFYSAGFTNLEYFIAYDIYADILGSAAKCKDGEIPLELADFTADYVFLDNIGIEDRCLWEIIASTIANKAKGVFLVDYKRIYLFKENIAEFCTVSAPSFIISEKVSHIIFLPNDLAIILIQKEKKNKDVVTLVNETNVLQINANTIWKDVANNQNSYILSMSEFNEIDFKFDFNRILQNEIRSRMSKNNNMLKLKHLLSKREDLQIDIYKFYKKNKTSEINNVYVHEFSKFLPYYTIKNNILVNIPEVEALEYTNKLLLVDMRKRSLFQPKILVFDNLDNISFSSDGIFVYKVKESLVNLSYLIKELNENYILEQLIPAQISKSHRWEELLECYIKFPDTYDSITPIERQKLLLNAEKMEFINKLLESYDYDVEKVINSDKAGLRANTELLGGQYKIIKSLGHGGFGKTYKAIRKENGNDGTIVVIKEFFDNKLQKRARGSNEVVFHSKYIKDIEVVRKKFHTEAEKIKTFDDCENIVKVYEVFDENNTSYYSMEYIDGYNLEKYIEKNGILDEKEAIKIIRKVANALKRMHSEKMLHADIKPGNIMIGKDGRVVLIDFGGAHKYNISPKDNSTLLYISSPGFTPFEKISQNSFEPSYDIYSLGATLNFMLTGCNADNLSENSKREDNVSSNNCLQNGQPNNISKEINECINKAMSKYHIFRQQSVDEFLEMLPCE